MKKLKFILSLTNNDNDYQIEQAAAAEQAAKRLDAEVQVIHAENDSVTQSQQLLKIIQSRSDSLPDGIIFEPVGGTAMPQVARAQCSIMFRRRTRSSCVRGMMNERPTGSPLVGDV